MELKPGPDGPVLSLWPPAASRNGPPVHYHLELGNGLTLVQCSMTHDRCCVKCSSFFFTLSIQNLTCIHFIEVKKENFDVAFYFCLLHLSTILLL